MEITILIFGQLTDFTGTDKLSLGNVRDTNSLIQQLQKQYPLFKTASYTIAVDKKVIKENTLLNSGATVALLPPFSGG